MRLLELQPRRVGLLPRFEHINGGEADFFRLVSLGGADQPHGALAGAEPDCQNAAYLVAANRTIEGSIADRLGEMRKVKVGQPADSCLRSLLAAAELIPFP